MLKKMLAILALSSLGVSAYAVDASQVEKSIELKGESTENGKNSTLSVRHAAATFS